MPLTPKVLLSDPAKTYRAALLNLEKTRDALRAKCREADRIDQEQGPAAYVDIDLYVFLYSRAKREVLRLENELWNPPQRGGEGT